MKIRLNETGRLRPRLRLYIYIVEVYGPSRPRFQVGGPLGLLTLSFALFGCSGRVIHISYGQKESVKVRVYEHVSWYNTRFATVLLLKSFHLRRSLFLITGGHHNPHKFRYQYSMVHQLPIKIFLLNSQKCRQKRQRNLPPLFTRRRSAGYYAILTNTNRYIQEI